MPITLSDKEIQDLIDEQKILPDNYQSHIIMKPKRGHKESEIDVHGINGSVFRVLFRQSSIDPFDFSVILGYLIPKTNVLFRLRRYNGRSHEHSNNLEKEKIYGYHIHQSTERYQRSGLKEDEYATDTNIYSDIPSAFQCMIQDCNFVPPPNSQLSF